MKNFFKNTTNCGLVIIIIPIFAILGILQGYDISPGDLATYIPFTLHEYDGAFFSDDLLIETISSHPVYIWKMLGLLLHFIPYILLFKLLFFLQTGLVTFASWFFYRRIFGNNGGWFLFLCMLVITEETPAIGVYGLNPYMSFHPGVIAFGLFLLIYLLELKGNYLWGGFLTGLLFLLHPYTAIYASIIYLMKIMLDWRSSSNKTHLITGIVLLIISASPSWLHFFSQSLQNARADFNMELWLKIVKMRVLEAFFISSWNRDRYLHIVMVFVVLIMFRRTEQFRKVLPIMLTTLAALSTMVFADIFRNKLLLQLQLGRCTYFIFFLCGMFIANRTVSVSWNDKRNTRLFWIFASYFMMVHAVIESDPGILRWILLLCIAAGLILSETLEFHKRIKVCTITSFILILLVTGFQTHDRYVETGRIYDTSGASTFNDIQIWCRNNIPKHETIMTPFNLPGFRVLSQHSIYGSFKDGGAHNYCNKTVFRWWDRMQKLGVNFETKPAEFSSLYVANAFLTAKDYRIKYVVCQTAFAPAGSQIIYSNDDYAVVDLETR